MKRSVQFTIFILPAFLGGLAVGYACFAQHASAVKSAADAKSSRRRSTNDYAKIVDGLNFNPSNNPNAGGAGKASSDNMPHPVTWDPKSPLGQIFDKYTGQERALAISALVDKTPPDQLAALMDSAAFCPQSTVRETLLNDALGKMAAANPQAALTYAEGLGVRNGGDDSYVHGVFDVWGGHDPQGAWAAAQQLNASQYRSTALYAVLVNWAQDSDPMDAIAAAKSLPPGAVQGNTLSDMYEKWSNHDPAAAFAALSQESDPNLVSSVQNTIISNMSRSDPQAALNMLGSLPPNDQQQNNGIYNRIFNNWGQQDPTAAAAAIAQLPDTAQAQAFNGMASGYATSDPQGAFAWAQTLPDANQSNQAASMAVSALAKANPANAWADVQSLPDSTARDNMLGQVANQWASQDPAKAATLMDDLSNPQQISFARNVSSNWLQSDPSAATAWVNTLPESPQRDAAVTQVVSNQANSDPAMAYTWAITITSDASRYNAIRNTVQQWGQNDAAAAAAAIETAPVTDTQRTSLQQNLQQIIDRNAAKNPALRQPSNGPAPF